MSKICDERIRERYQQLLINAKLDICALLNSEFDEVIYIRDNELYVDCSDYGSRDIKIS